MVRYTARWVTYADEQRRSLSADARQTLDDKLALLCTAPRRYGDYSPTRDQWSTHFGDGWGVVLYTIEDRWNMITVLRVSWAK
ncbi:hypothetical protein [Frankia sp. CiP3]|uniref:hypothetical protein n=1 Tax=Frankia sp. CiP3 TaxID=2880971 RepID=UPI001EF3EF1D|nr:hypothetical protein [Frankia sp. CiP3]